MKSVLENNLLLQIKAVKLPIPEQQYMFHDTRKWRFDFAWPDIKLAVEVDGGTWINGGHNRGSGIERDCEKYGEAMLFGWDIYRCTGNMVKHGRAIKTIEQLFILKSFE